MLSPLDWGLGHTTRCIPIIHELLHQGCDVIIACNSTQKALLIREFPQLTYEPLTGYNLKYGKNRWGTIVRIILQTPKILTKINTENTWINIFLKSQAVDLIISDNRFGFYAPGIPSVFITHQLNIRTGLGKFTDHLAQWFNYRRIKNFSTCWIPDYKGEKTLAGRLSNPGNLPAVPVQYIGGLSRFNTCKDRTATIDLLIILSGPEPQRSLFEDQLLKALKHQPGKTVLVRGLPEGGNSLVSTADVTIYDHAPASLLNTLICDSALVISRSGYTTVMDLLKLGKKSIMVPTPGQAEQEYVAAHLHQQQLAFSVSQTDFSLPDVLAAAKAFAYQLHSFDMEVYKKTIGSLIGQIRNAGR
ncbi:glycosyltransferase [Longitalea luteola]|uniref:glycosyltransferase n=1 Tax=Longitalea luteola TaxID=2812563 RepID=UPI001A97C92D|nr:glycosyltransferase [Longitalea luteola]